MNTRKYKTIVADPPWKYGKWGKASKAAFAVSGISESTNKDIEMPYAQMSVEEISKLPIGKLSDNNCELYLWTTGKYLHDAFHVMSDWGFKYCQTLTWCKAPRGLGQGGAYCPTTEFLLLGRKGKIPQGKRRENSTWWQVKRPHNNHSAKPEFFQDMIERVTDAPRLEMFARRERAGWDVFGNEVKNSISLPNASVEE